MKTTKKIISLLLTIQMLFACALIPSAIATDSVIEEPIDVVVEALVIDEGENSEELSPMMARGCSSIYKRYDSLGNIYSVTFYNEIGQVEARIDYQGTPHFIDGEYRLPHQHNYTYHYGPNGEGPNRKDAPTYMNFRPWE